VPVKATQRCARAGRQAAARKQPEVAAVNAVKVAKVTIAAENAFTSTIRNQVTNPTTEYNRYLMRMAPAPHGAETATIP